MPKRVVVAGATGLVGNAALRHFGSVGGAEVIALSRRKPRELYGARFVPVLLEQHPDILIATTRGDCYRHAGGRVLHTVERQGVTLLYVFDLRAKNRS